MSQPITNGNRPWLRLLIWMGAGLVLYFVYGLWNSTLGKQLRGLIPSHVAATARSGAAAGRRGHPAARRRLRARRRLPAEGLKPCASRRSTSTC
jgi:hypothetical protein